MGLEDLKQDNDRCEEDVSLNGFEELEFWALIEGHHKSGFFFQKKELLEDWKARFEIK